MLQYSTLGHWSALFKITLAFLRFLCLLLSFLNNCSVLINLIHKTTSVPVLRGCSLSSSSNQEHSLTRTASLMWNHWQSVTRYTGFQTQWHQELSGKHSHTKVTLRPGFEQETFGSVLRLAFHYTTEATYFLTQQLLCFNFDRDRGYNNTQQEKEKVWMIKIKTFLCCCLLLLHNCRLTLALDCGISLTLTGEFNGMGTTLMLFDKRNIHNTMGLLCQC